MQYSQTRYEDSLSLGIGDTDLSLTCFLVPPTRTQGILTIGRLQGNTEDVYYTNVVANTVTIALRGLSTTALTPTQVIINRKVHNANESLEITTHHLYDANKTRVDENETVSGDWEFTGTETFADDKARSKTNAAPIDEKSFANKKYVDDQVSGVADIKFKVSSDDTTPGFAEDKITVTAPLILSTTSPGGDEKRNISMDYTATTFAPTVTLVGGTGNVVPTFTTNEGRYTKIGRIVFVDVYLYADYDYGDATGLGAGTGRINIALPIQASASHAPMNCPAGSYYVNNKAPSPSPAERPIYGAIDPSGSAIQLAVRSSSTTNIPDLTGDSFSNAPARRIRLKFFYEI